jgi:TRAP-type C4-dicarboxylate transport system substrate-binding protein
VKFVSMTNHMWSGFNQLAHLPTWQRLPVDLRTTIDRNVTRFVRLQRQDQERMNTTVRAAQVERGLVFNDVDPAAFRSRLSGVYAKWKGTLGTRCWSLLETSAGSLT